MNVTSFLANSILFLSETDYITDCLCDACNITQGYEETIELINQIDYPTELVTIKSANSLVIAGFTINFGFTVCEFGDEDMNLKTIFINNDIRKISFRDFRRIMNCNPKGFCYIKCLDERDQEPMIGVVHEYYTKKLEECSDDMVLQIKKEIFSGGIGFPVWLSLMETNIYLSYNYDIFYKLGNKRGNKDHIYAVKLSSHIVRNSNFETKQLLLTFNHIENAEGKFIDAIDMEMETFLGPLIYCFESDVSFNHVNEFSLNTLIN